MTRWDALFADLDAQASALAAAELGAEVDARTRGEIAESRLPDRVRAALGQPVQLTLAGGVRVEGRLVRSGPDWLALAEEHGRQLLAPLSGLVTVRGLPRFAAAAVTGSSVDARWGWRAVVREVSRDRSPVRVHLVDGSVLDATVDRVAADHLDLAVHTAGEWRRAREVRDVLTVPSAAVAALRRDAPPL